MKTLSLFGLLLQAALLVCHAEDRPVVPIAAGSLLACEPTTNLPTVPLRPLDDAMARELSQAFEQGCAKAPPASKGLSVAVIVPGKGVWTAQRGNDGHGSPISNTTRFHAGSAGKLITSALVAQAVATGHIEPTAPLSRYVEVAKSWRQIPVATLLNHSSGIPSFEMNGAYDRTKPATPRELLELADKPLFPAGSAHSYSNTGYVLLGLVLEKTEGLPWSRQVTERVFARLSGLAARTAPEISAGDLAVGYVNRTPVPFLADYRNVFSCGGVICSALDLARLYDDVLNGRMLTPEATRFLLSDMVLAEKRPEGIEVRAGRGVNRVVTPKGIVLMHGGSIPGFVCSAGTGLSSGISVTVMSNQAETVTDPFFFALLQAAEQSPRSLP